MFRKLLICVLVGVLAGCGAAEKKKLTNLNDSIESYGYALRWSRSDEAREFHLERDHTRWEIDLSAMDEIRVTSYKIRNRVVNKTLDEATVEAELNYYNEQYGTVKNMTLEQQWWYDPESERWYIESDFPTFD